MVPLLVGLPVEDLGDTEAAAGDQVLRERVEGLPEARVLLVADRDGRLQPGLGGVVPTDLWRGRERGSRDGEGSGGEGGEGGSSGEGGG